MSAVVMVVIGLLFVVQSLAKWLSERLLDLLLWDLLVSLSS